MELKKSVVAEILEIISVSQSRAIRSVDAERVLMYWQIGRVIFEEEQQGKSRADYGSFLIKSISDEFQPQFGTGFTIRQLELNRQFYRTFPNTNALRSQFSWTHYRTLVRIDNEDKRDFYIAEAEKNNWTARQLERQVNSQLFERLLLSNDLKSVLAVAREEKLPVDAKEIIKDPMVLEFLGLKRDESYYERDLEKAIITHLHDFILELGNGFTFVARQKRNN
jgi:predicted nuclease of restriction endonuclease-like (RecB) superfamily